MRAHSISAEASRLHSSPGAASDFTIARQLLPNSEALNRPRARARRMPTLGPGRTPKRGRDTVGWCEVAKPARGQETPAAKARPGRRSGDGSSVKPEGPG